MSDKILYISDGYERFAIENVKYSIDRQPAVIYTMGEQEVVYDELVERRKVHGSFSVPDTRENIYGILGKLAKRDTIIRADDVMIYRCKLLSQRTVDGYIHVKFTARSSDEILVRHREMSRGDK